MHIFEIIVFSLVFIIGLLRLISSYFETKKKYDFSLAYRNKYVDFTNKFFQKKLIDNELYFYLTKNSDKMQQLLGVIGIIDYRPPFANYMLKNYQFVLNTLPKFKTNEIHNTDVTYLEDMFTRKYGILEESLESYKKKLLNPIIWFQYGVQFVLLFPVLILSWFGLFDKRTISNIVSNFIFSFFSKIIALTTFISGIVTIVVGKDKFIETITNVFSKL